MIKNKDAFIKKTDVCNFNTIKNFLDEGGNPNYIFDNKNSLVAQLMNEYWQDKLHERDCFKIVNLLLSRGADPNVRDSNSLTPLHWATHLSLKLTKLFLKNGAHINIMDREGFTPLHNAAGSGLARHKKITKLLLDYGAEIYSIAINVYHYSVLYDAVAAGNYQIIRMLLKQDMKKGKILLEMIEEKYGRTSLHLAVLNPLHSSIKIITLLLKHGANIYAKDFEGVTPFQIVSKFASPRYLKVRELFIKYKRKAKAN
ncbi:ankyrin repeat domain-containing protein [Rickettsiella endosymbiont of Dermanyssus gallinae]|uniref:ankyrin repeat domain-containing protein n=1 Tax=Rickettsiella endosymbiont of Dermanyssus gallinae TaxID=2856608 RepID=UPI001C52E50A|nr:ankyrin repeat domain-containing protein [Rickettsiella endosymbiont of Dermanyssus gallinae]